VFVADVPSISKDIAEAYRQLEFIQDPGQRDLYRSTIAEAIVHFHPDGARVMLDAVVEEQHKYRVTMELYAAYGLPGDCASVIALIEMMRASGEDVEEEEEQLARVQKKLATGWRAGPVRMLSDKDMDRDRLRKSEERIRRTPSVKDNAIIYIGELCIRIQCEDFDSVSQAIQIAGDDAELRDRVTTAMAKAHAIHGRPGKAREMLSHVTFPEHRIDVLLTIDAVTREMGLPPDEQTVH
jgi:hypothetical protein